jgi:hypothetical protein
MSIDKEIRREELMQYLNEEIYNCMEHNEPLSDEHLVMINDMIFNIMVGGKESNGSMVTVDISPATYQYLIDLSKDEEYISEYGNEFITPDSDIDVRLHIVDGNMNISIKNAFTGE